MYRVDCPVSELHYIIPSTYIRGRCGELETGTSPYASESGNIKVTPHVEFVVFGLGLFVLGFFSLFLICDKNNFEVK